MYPSGTSYKSGLQSLPAEILRRIFRFSCDPRQADHIKIASVCRRFRDVALDDPTLWSSISSANSLEYIIMQLERSKGSKLTVDYTMHFHLDRGSKCACHIFWRMLLERCDLWQEVSVIYDVVHQHSDAGILGILQGLSLPSLRSLALTSESDTCTYKGVANDVCQTWHMPKLEKFQGELGKRLLRMPFIAPLRVVHFSLGQYDFDVMDMALGILEYPHVVEARELHLKFNKYTHIGTKPSVMMNNVRKLTLELLDADFYHDSLCFASEVSCPRINHIVVILHVDLPKTPNEERIRDLCQKTKGLWLLASELHRFSYTGVDKITINVRDGHGEDESLRWYRDSLQSGLMDSARWYLADSARPVGLEWEMGLPLVSFRIEG